VKGRWARFLLALGEALGSAAWGVGFRRRVALDGLRRAFPEWTEEDRRAMGRAAYRQLGRSLAEVALARNLRDADLDDLVRFDNWEVYESARALGRGVVVAVAHFGNWEVLARACARRGVPLTAITRALRGRLNQQLLAARREGGLRELPDKGSTGAALRLLRRGETLAVVVDQNMRPSRGVFVDFFGTPACTTPAAAVLALRSGAPLLAAFPVRAADGTHRVRLEGPFSPPPGARGRSAVLALTQEVTRAVERAVRERPDHWFWVHRRWKTRPGEALPPPAR
jgi:Kdo2-lipid IVA lauroyltransferase/acyltransferase